MELRQLGRTGLHVSALGLGTMTWGRDTDEIDAAEQLREFVAAGGTLVDTAASYGDGDSESVLGEILRGAVDRRDVQICTKAGVRRSSSGTVVDASRAGLLDSLDASLTRLGTDHVDLFLVQCPDPSTPLVETVSALRHAVTSGRARYVGLSNHTAWQTARAATLLEASGDAELAAVEVEYSLLERGIEREVVPAADELGTGVLAWSPLGRGVLTGKYRHALPADSRGASPHLSGFVETYLDRASSGVVEAVATAADGLGRAPLEVALAWLLARDVASAIVGARTPAQLRASIAALDLELPAAVLHALDDVSAPTLGYPEAR
ncbi:aryl-alcohol dehydrogenase-like predicted oxidoreductase [Sediminihabitans luteus]|uniref:Aryl-alcohol dehydrogenase-like predicted oxidoreductase n=1 Tax=Sediminihabitans luteus TaxID=1138585 RepID=A0A2M9CR21_9CELL|nr:aldo/keto reductase [Sediminihabitans luteus]PJJ74372.1 aryl-alcohol dehydrogenase-like predicted oxidoreductase [Sediminihabitans luteus]GIJ00262.1 oxidoreductase [Sediminihabitans luteus]